LFFVVGGYWLLRSLKDPIMSVIDGVEYAVIGADLGLTRQQCANMVRRVSERVREALREVVRGEGVAAEDVERTVREIEDLLGGG
jgi:hypothetical protein